MILNILVIIFLFIAFRIHRKAKKIFDPLNNKSVLTIYKEFFKFLFHVAQVFLFKPVIYEHKILNKKQYIKIPYTYKEVKYYYMLKVPRGVEPISEIKDENGNDIYNIVKPYLGPNLDCHGTKMTPDDFGYEKIELRTVSDKVIIFEKNEQIVM
jgi:hypothetical protein